MRAIYSLVLSLGLLLGFFLGIMVARPASPPSPSNDELTRIQKRGDMLFPPIWRSMFRDKSWLREMRRRGHVYCYRNGAIDPACAGAQDEAVQQVVLALMASKAQQDMVDQTALSRRESEVARNPALRSRIIRYCAHLYDDHGGRDARILAVCLGNLSDFSPLVPIPVP